MRAFTAAFVLLARSLVVLADLRSALEAQGIDATLPGDKAYDSARQAFNLRFSVKPAGIAYPKNAEQVSKVVTIGVQEKLRVVARGGGHSYIANGLGGADGALVVDMRNLKNIEVDASGASAVIEAGNRLGDVALALNNANRGLPHGTCPYVGFAGHAAFGGFGFTSRMWGLTLDAITAVNVVLANGTVARATPTSYPDLFWALRGSAASFGIATSIEVKTFPAPASVTVFSYSWNLSPSDAAKAIASFESFSQTDVPAQLGAEVNLHKGSSRGTVQFSLGGAWYGKEDQFEGHISPLLDLLPGNPKVSVQSGSYLDSLEHFSGQGSLDTSAPDKPDTFYAKSVMTPQSQPISIEALTNFMTYLGNEGYDSNTFWFVQVRLFGGRNSAVNNVGTGTTAFAHRSSTFLLQLYAASESHFPPFPDSGLTFLDGVIDSITSQGSNYEAYPNYLDNRLSNWQAHYYGSNYGRLASVKKQYDPNDVFSFPTAVQG